MPSGRDSFRRNRVAPFVLFILPRLADMPYWRPFPTSSQFLRGKRGPAHAGFRVLIPWFHCSTRHCGIKLLPDFLILPVSDMRHQRHDGIRVSEAPDTVPPDQTPGRIGLPLYGQVV
jgi:hypothetical protein